MTKDQDMLQTEDQEALVVVTDDKGNKTYYACLLYTSPSPRD